MWQRLYPYEQTFVGQWYEEYLEQRHGHHEELNLVSLLIGLALSIAGLGLLGVVTYQTETRTKEVGIRKVMGATVAQVVGLLSWGCVKLLGLVLLSNFAYRVSIGLETLGCAWLCWGWWAERPWAGVPTGPTACGPTKVRIIGYLVQSSDG